MKFAGSLILHFQILVVREGINMRINREKLLSELSMVKAGLSAKETIQQSSCVCFDDGLAMTFNDQVACRIETDLHITGAVPAAALMMVLDKLPDEELDVVENDQGELEFRGKGRRFAVTKEKEIFLPIDQVAMPKKWQPLPDGFGEAVGVVAKCAGTDESEFAMLCVHLTPTMLEGCDNFQMLRQSMKTGLAKEICIRATSLKPIAQLGMDEFCVTDAWLHFRNASDLIYSVREELVEYPLLDELLGGKGHPIKLPKDIVDASDRASIFAEDMAGDASVNIDLKDGGMRISGSGMSGWYKELRKVDYKGPPLSFTIRPNLLKHLCENYSEASVNESKIIVSGERWTYVAALGEPK
jgi:hypothetical protein